MVAKAPNHLPKTSNDIPDRQTARIEVGLVKNVSCNKFEEVRNQIRKSSTFQSTFLIIHKWQKKFRLSALSLPLKHVHQTPKTSRESLHKE